MQYGPSPEPAYTARVGSAAIETQRKPVAYALFGAAAFFVVLGTKNAIDRDFITAGLCGIAIGVAMLYGMAIYHNRGKPFSDGILTALAVCVIAVTIERRGLVGVLWVAPVMMMLHLVTHTRAAAVFDGCAVVIATTLMYLQVDGVTAFRAGAILIISSAFAHIYARIMASHQARQEEQRRHLDLMISCANVGGLEWDTKNPRMRCSPRLLSMLGNPSDYNAPGWNILDCVHPQDRERVAVHFFGALTEPAPPGAVQKAKTEGFRFVTAQGDTVWVHAEAIAVSSDSGAVQSYLATFLDVSQVRAAEADTLTALKRQTELNELRARFVAMASHEFRTPLATILSSAELLKQYADQLSAQDRTDILASIEVGVQRMTAMLDNILLVNKADAQMLEFQPERVDVRQLCASLVNEVRPQADSKPCSIEMECHPVDPMGYFDPKLMHHIFGNLLSNAIKYSPPGESVTFRMSGESNQFVFEVIDHGIGIPPGDLNELFEPFHRGSNVADIKGTGLGLAIVKKSVELHRGQIAVESAIGRGSCFRVTLSAEIPSNG